MIAKHPRAARIDAAVKAVAKRIGSGLLDERFLLETWVEDPERFLPFHSIKHAFREVTQ